MSRKRKRPSRDPRYDDGIPRSQPPSRRLKPLFSVCHEVAHAADLAAMEAGPAHVGTQAQFERSFFMRGVNTLKAAWIVAGPGHWEVAAACARQLFELVLNMEYISRDHDREPAASRFARFGLLQDMQSVLAEIEYARDTGRPYDEAQVEAIEHNLELEVFDEFKSVKKDGSIIWQWTWNGKTTYAMAKESADPLRLLQYQTLFRRWSEEAHAAPGALARTMFRVSRGEDWFEEVIADDIKQTVDVLYMAVTLFLELWLLVSDSIPYDSPKALDWMQRLSAIIEDRRDLESESSSTLGAPTART